MILPCAGQERNGGLLSEAQNLAEKHGWIIVPVLDKMAVVKWKPYQRRRPDPGEMVKAFGRRHTGMAVVCGPAVHVRDFDQAGAYDAWADAHPALARTLPTSLTARGAHVYHQGGPDRLIPLDDGEYRGAAGY